jgi:hypothetical protein
VGEFFLERGGVNRELDKTMGTSSDPKCRAVFFKLPEMSSLQGPLEQFHV